MTVYHPGLPWYHLIFLLSPILITLSLYPVIPYSYKDTYQVTPYTHRDYHLFAMSDLDYHSMKQLLDDQVRTLLAEMKDLVKAEVAKQIEPHLCKVTRLQKDHALIKEQLCELMSKCNIRSKPLLTLPSPSSPHKSEGSSPSLPTQAWLCSPITTTQASPCTLTSTTLQPVLGPNPSTSTLPIEPNTSSTIESAKRTLCFYPIYSDTIRCMKTDPDEEVSIQTLLSRSLYSFLHYQLQITASEIPVLVSDTFIQHDPKSCKLTVKFPSLKQVKTIFRFVKNLPQGQKVSLFIPQVLSELHSQLRAQAYQLRHGEVRHKTVIKYHGHTLALYAKSLSSSTWVPVYPPVPGNQKQCTKNLQTLTMSHPKLSS